MTFFYDLNKKLASIGTTQVQLNESVQAAQEDIYMEKIEPPIKTDPAERGKYKGQGVADLKKQMSSVKDRMAGYKERGEKVPAELRGKFSELTFAIRAKQAHGGKWGKIKETDQEDLEPWQQTMKEADMEEGNEFSGELAKARATGAKSFKVDGKEYAVKEGAKPDFLDLDKDGNRKESMKKAARDAKLAKIDMAKEGIEDVPTYIRDRMGKPRLTPADLKKPGAFRYRVGEKEFMDQRAAQEFASGTGQKVEPIAEKREKTLWPGTPEYEKQFPKTMKTGEKMTTHKGGEVEKTATGIKHTARYDDDAEDTKADDGAPKKRGRPKGKDKGPERVTAKAWKHKGGRVKEGMEDEEMIAVVDRGEYDREGDMAHDQLRTIEDAARELASIIDADDNLPEWVQSKITKAMDYIDTARDHLKSKEGGDQPVAEKAVSKAQQRFMGMVHAAQKGEKPASKAVAKVAKEMPKKAAKDFAATKHKGLPEKIKKDESVDETADEAPKTSKKMGGIQFGKGVYEAMDEALEKVITESINVSVNMSTDEQGEPRKSISVNAEGEDADRLAELLNLAGIQGHQQVDEVDENQADWPTAEVESGEDPNLQMYAGGLNKPKSSGQTVDAPPNLELRRNGFGVKESTDLGMNLYKELQQFKGR